MRFFLVTLSFFLILLAGSHLFSAFEELDADAPKSRAVTKQKGSEPEIQSTTVPATDEKAKVSADEDDEDDDDKSAKDEDDKEDDDKDEAEDKESDDSAGEELVPNDSDQEELTPKEELEPDEDDREADSDKSSDNTDDDDSDSKKKAQTLNKKDKVKKELERRLKALYPEPTLNPPLQNLCRENPQVKDALSGDQLDFYCKIHGEFRACYSKHVLYNNDIDRSEKVKIAKSCIDETKGYASRFEEDHMRLHDLNRLADFEEVFLEVMLPKPEKPEPVSPSRSEDEPRYKLWGDMGKDEFQRSKNYMNQKVKKLEYVDKTFDQLDQEVLKLKKYPKRIYKQYPNLISQEILLLDTLPERVDKHGKVTLYEFRKEQCLVRPMSASQCEAVIKENQRREIAEKNQSIDVNPDRIRFQKDQPINFTQQ